MESQPSLNNPPTQSATRKPPGKCIRLWNADRTKSRYVTPYKADELLDKREAFDCSIRVHGKPRTARELQMYSPERKSGHSPAAISFAEIQINAGVGHPNPSVFVPREEELAVRRKVRVWNELTKELRREITVFAT